MAKKVPTHICPICKGTGELTEKDAGYARYALEQAQWAIEVQKELGPELKKLDISKAGA